MKAIFLYKQKRVFIGGVLMLLIINSATLFSQDILTKGLDSVQSFFNIKYEGPSDFKNANKVQAWRMHDSGGVFGGLFKSEEGQCEVLYNLLPYFDENGYSCESSQRGFTYKAIKNELNSRIPLLMTIYVFCRLMRLRQDSMLIQFFYIMFR